MWPLRLLAVGIVVWLLRLPIAWAGGRLALAAGHLLQRVTQVPLLNRFPGFQYANQNWDIVAGYFGVHLRLTVESLAVAIALAIPVGILVHRFRWLYIPTFGVLDAIYTVPSIALFTLLLPVTGLSDWTALIPMIAYAQFVLVRNVVAGLDSVPAEVKEAARGMGMNRFQILSKVEFPLALPVIVAGIRIATVVTIGIAALAALVAIPDLGRTFFDATTNGGTNAFPMIEAGAVFVSFLAIGADLVLRAVEYVIPANRVARAGSRGWLRSLAGSLIPSRVATEDPVAPQSA